METTSEQDEMKRSPHRERAIARKSIGTRNYVGQRREFYRQNKIITGTESEDMSGDEDVIYTSLSVGYRTHYSVTSNTQTGVDHIIISRHIF